MLEKMVPENMGAVNTFAVNMLAVANALEKKHHLGSRQVRDCSLVNQNFASHRGIGRLGVEVVRGLVLTGRWDFVS